MTIDEIKSLKGSSELPFTINSEEFTSGNLIINQKIALPVVTVASYFKTIADISIYNETGTEVAVLCFTKEMGKKSLSELTEDQFIVFLNEGNYNNLRDPHGFQSNYVLVKDTFYDEYVAHYMKTAPIWGGFAHYHADIKTDNHTISTSVINLKKIVLEPKIFLENASRAIAQPYGFERFLKFYHLLELRFDYEVIKKIKDADIELEPELIGNLLSEYNRAEFPRLLDIIASNCDVIPPIVARLNDLKHFPNLANDIFFKFGTGKENNPFKGQHIHFNNVLPGGFEEHNLRSHSVNYQANYPKFIQTFAAFVVYRIRCSIAHNKLGEYILSMDQEDFIVDFGEPLLRELLFQSFKS